MLPIRSTFEKNSFFEFSIGLALFSELNCNIFGGPTEISTNFGKFLLEEIEFLLSSSLSDDA